MESIYISETILTGILSVAFIIYGIYSLIQSNIFMGIIDIILGVVWIGCCLLWIKLTKN